MAKSTKQAVATLQPGDAKRGDDVLARMLRTKPLPNWKPPVKKKATRPPQGEQES